MHVRWPPHCRSWTSWLWFFDINSLIYVSVLQPCIRLRTDENWQQRTYYSIFWETKRPRLESNGRQIFLITVIWTFSVLSKVLMLNWLFSHSFALQQVDTTLLGLSEKDARNNPYIASMGVYVFRTDVLLKLLRWSYPSCNDFGSEIIPSAVREHNVQVRQKYLHILLCVII